MHHEASSGAGLDAVAWKRPTVIGRLTALFRELRLSRPWTYKAPFLISVPYYLLVLGSFSLGKALGAILASAVTILGIAGIAYLLNDLADRDADAKAGKPNFVLDRKPSVVLALALLFAALALVPWVVVLPLTPRTAGLLVFELALFLAYSLPPARLKDRGGLGAFADALYAHVNPALLAAFTFARLGGVTDEELLPFVAVLGLWQLALGLRNILLHQLLDLENDRAAGTLTWVAGLGVDRAERLLRYIVVPGELGLFAAYVVLVAADVRALAPGLIVFIVLTSWVIKARWKRALPRDLRNFLFNYVDDFYVEWIPVLILLELAVREPAFLVLLAFHLVLYPKNALRRMASELQPRPA
jgi:4-hydroxybenzoate polyprenyltransferase